MMDGLIEFECIEPITNLYLYTITLSDDNRDANTGTETLNIATTTSASSAGIIWKTIANSRRRRTSHERPTPKTLASLYSDARMTSNTRGLRLRCLKKILHPYIVCHLENNKFLSEIPCEKLQPFVRGLFYQRLWSKKIKNTKRRTR